MNEFGMWSKNISFTNGNLHLSGIPVSQLAKDFGTPAFFLDEDDFRTRALGWKSALTEEFGPHTGNVFYAAKAFISVEVAKWIQEIGIGIDVCSGGELSVALAGGIDPEKIEVHGNNKSLDEIDRAVHVGVKAIVVDSLQEIDRVAAMARKYKKTQQIFLRLTPGIQAHTHESISTAHEDVKFGFSIASGAAWLAVEEAAKHPELELRGIHCHVGSQIFGTESFELAAERLIAFLAKYRDAFGSQLPELDLGGGYGIAYLPEDETVQPGDVIPALGNAVRKFCQLYALDLPLISIEPGRAIVGPSMFTLYEVGTTKDVVLEDGKIRRYISIDGGMSDNIRPSLYDAEYHAILAGRESTAPFISSRIVGKHCETGDIVIKSIDLPSDISPGDLIAVPATGAYGRSMASNYNHIPRPPVVAVKGSQARVILRRENNEDLLALDVKE